MACETKTKTIDGEVWKVVQMPASQALALESRLLPAVAQGIGPLVAAMGKTASEQGTAISQAFAVISKALPPDDFAEIVRDLCSQAIRGNRRVDFEQDFSGGKGVLLRYQVAWFVLEANFADFFDALLPQGARDRAAEAFKSRIDGAAAEAA